MPSDGNEIEVLCPKCKVPMNFYSRTERSTKSGSVETKIVRYYRCPVCGRVIVDEELTIRIGPDGASIVNKHNGLSKSAIIVVKPVSRVG